MSALVVVFWVVGFALLVAAGMLVASYIWFYTHSLKNGAGKRVLASSASRAIMDEFNKLPKENRPYPESTLRAVVTALDVKHGVNKVDEHFRERGYERSWFEWDACFHKGDCVGREYKELHYAIKRIEDELAEQKHAFAMAGIAHQLDRVKELTEALHQERDIIRSVTTDMIKD